MMSTFPASLLILNGKGANEPQLREAVNLLRDEGIDIHVRVTWETVSYTHLRAHET